MTIPQTAPLFAWSYLEDNRDLRTIADLLSEVPDAPLPAYLEGRRGRDRNEYPVAVLWGTLLLTNALRHTSIPIPEFLCAPAPLPESSIGFGRIEVQLELSWSRRSRPDNCQPIDGLKM